MFIQNHEGPDLCPLCHDGISLRNPVARHGGHDGNRPMTGKYNKNIAKHKARPTDVAGLQPLLKAKVDEPCVKPGEIEEEKGGDVAME